MAPQPLANFCRTRDPVLIEWTDKWRVGKPQFKFLCTCGRRSLISYLVFGDIVPAIYLHHLAFCTSDFARVY